MILRQASLDFTPPPAPEPPVRDQRVPKPSRRGLQRMSRLILERLREGPALSSELHAMFPGARSIRTRISDVGRWLADHGERLHSEPVGDHAGDWRYEVRA